MSYHVYESYANVGVTYFRITDSLDYSSSSLDAIKPILDIAATNPGTISKETVYDNAMCLMFETLNKVDTLMATVRYPKSVKFVFGVAGTDTLVSKSMLAITLRTFYDVSIGIIPKTYIMENGIDKDRFLSDYQGGIYIMKKNIQRQEGCMITDDRASIMRGFDAGNDYVVVQELLQDPLVVGGRKTNIRIYMLAVVTPGSGTKFYMYNDGFMYYTPQPFVAGTTDADLNITTGYIDRQVYVDNPLTFQDLLMSLPPVNANLLYKNIVALFNLLIAPYIPIFTNENSTLPGVKFTIFGCDIAPSSNFGAKLMEVNKGPDLGYKDDRDRILKQGMVREALGIVGILPALGSKFLQLG